MRSPAVWTARERGSDNVLTFILRGVNRILSDQSQANEAAYKIMIGMDKWLDPDLLRQFGAVAPIQTARSVVSNNHQ
jgi:hypothetical protein